MILKAYKKLMSFAFLTKSSIKIVFLPDFLESKSGDLKIRGANSDEIDEINNIYEKLSFQSLSKYQRIQFKLHSKKTIIVAEQYVEGIKRLVGMDMYYLNPRDFSEGTIHEGFIGVLPESEGQGVATQMRKQAIEHFRNAGFKGISTRISKHNLGSLNSAKKLGFEPVEKYFDSAMNQDRYYLICNLKEKK